MELQPKNKISSGLDLNLSANDLKLNTKLCTKTTEEKQNPVRTFMSYDQQCQSQLSSDGSYRASQVIEYQNVQKPQGNCITKCFKQFFQKYIFKQVKHQYQNSIVFSNIPDCDLPDNKISTAKYNVINFLPKNLFKQFTQMANIYFLLLGFIQLIPQVTTSDGLPIIWVPLFIIVSVTAIKDGYEDIKRHISDNQENNREISVVRNEKLMKTTWQDLKVGEIIKINDKEYLPCDVIVLSTSEQKGSCYIETKNLDGETNLKNKKAHKDFQFLSQADNEASQLKILNSNQIKFKFENPNPFLYVFNGQFEVDKNVGFLDNNNVILRGCSLRNTEWIYGMVIYTGHFTKIMLNSVKARPKLSKVQKMMNTQIIFILIMQLCFCLLSALYYAIWYKSNKIDLKYLEIAENSNEDSFFFNLISLYGTWLLIYQNFVPISLLVTLEMVKFCQGIIITNDEEIVSTIKATSNDEQDEKIPVTVQSSSLNEELGQIEYIFSDKTGTLTCNLMEFKNVCINGVNYGSKIIENEKNQVVIERDLENEISEEQHNQNPQVTNVDFRDKRLFEDLQKNNNHQKHLKETMLMLAFCHTVIVDKKSGQTQYNASSPDELALVSFAKYCGFEFYDMDANNIMTVKYNNQEYQYKLLMVFEFSSARKRMSVVLKDLNSDKVIIFCKGADSIIEKRLSKDINQELFKNTFEQLVQYGKVGLRTLLLAKREMTLEEFEQWESQIFKPAALSTENRDKNIEDAYEKIEIDFEMLGATAIEDKLQDNVGPTISVLKQAGIKLWVLTGDKVETAINIGYSCQLLNDDIEQIFIDGEDSESVQKNIQEAYDILMKEDADKQFSLILTGSSLKIIMDNNIKKRDDQKKLSVYIKNIMYEKSIQEAIMGIAQKCNVVIACRVSPKQKQEVVMLVRNMLPNVSTLAVGDGANDVNMITAAHVGVGIRGVEGQQAARASDYAIGEFKHLSKLILYYGRENYRRNTVLICYNFYKNMILCLPLFWYGFYNGFSGILYYNNQLYNLFNVCYTSFPIMIYALWDKEFESEEIFLQRPYLYQDGRLSLLFSKRIFWYWIISGIIQACILTYTTFITLGGQNDFTTYGLTGEQFLAGAAVYTLIVLNSNIKIILFSNQISVFNISIIVLGFSFYLSNYGIFSYSLPVAYNSFTQAEDIYNTCTRLLNTGNFYFLLFFQIASTTFMDYALTQFLKMRKLVEYRQRQPIEKIQSPIQPKIKIPLQQQVQIGFNKLSVVQEELVEESFKEKKIETKKNKIFVLPKSLVYGFSALIQRESRSRQNTGFAFSGGDEKDSDQTKKNWYN